MIDDCEQDTMYYKFVTRRKDTWISSFGDTNYSVTGNIWISFDRSTRLLQKTSQEIKRTIVFLSAPFRAFHNFSQLPQNI